MLIYENMFTKRTAVIAVLLKMVSELYQSRCNLSAFNVNRDTSSKAINAKPMGTILSAISQHGHKLSYQCQNEPKLLTD